MGLTDFSFGQLLILNRTELWYGSHFSGPTKQSGPIFKTLCIANNIIATEELIFNLHKRKMSSLALKVDFVKAFNFLDYNFLLEILAAKGFGSCWIF